MLCRPRARVRKPVAMVPGRMAVTPMPAPRSSTRNAAAKARTPAFAALYVLCSGVPAIAAMLATDPATAPHCARAGERLICVAEPKLAAFRKGLARLGLVLPETPGG